MEHIQKIIYRHGYHDGDAISEATGFDTGRDDKVRAEFAEEADVNVIVGRYGAPQSLPNAFGVADYTVDAHEAYNAARSAGVAYGKLPEAIRDKYPSWQRLLEAALTGDLTPTEKAAVIGEQTPKAEPQN